MDELCNSNNGYVDIPPASQRKLDERKLDERNELGELSGWLCLRKREVLYFKIFVNDLD